MDNEKLAHFVTEYKQLDGEELAELHNHRSTLIEEAIAALDIALSQRGINKEILAKNEDTAQSVRVHSEAELAKQLWNSWLTRTCNTAFALAGISLAPLARGIFSWPFGFLWFLLLILFLAITGYKVGALITKQICADEDISYGSKRRILWFLFIGGFFLASLLSAIIKISVGT